MLSFESLLRLTSSPTLFLLFVVAVSLTIYALALTYTRRIPENAPPVVTHDLPLTGALGFWTHRWDWYRQKSRAAATGNFSFHAGPNTLVALSGEKGRRLFFESRELGFSEGYAVLFGQAPRVDERMAKEEDLSDELNHYVARRLAMLLKPGPLQKKLPSLISDVQEGIDAISKEPAGRTDPFQSIYRIVFRLTVRMVGAEEIANDPELLETTLKYFEMIDKSATPAAVMFPKFPTPALIKRTYAGGRLYIMIEKLVKRRAESGEKHDDALQYLLDQGDPTFRIIEFLVGALFAGLLNSGINAAWVLCYLATSPEWLEKCSQELRAVAGKYSSNINAPLRHQLDDVPLDAWENEFPMVDLCLKDSIRLNLLGTAFRKNISGKAIPTGNGNEVIPPGAFVTYATGDVHLDPNVYPEPEKWDPSRYLPERAEDKKVTHGYLGWGVARHPCLGMRFAKLEQNIITAYFLAAFDFELQDMNGTKLTIPPLVNFNGHSAQKPKVPQYLQVQLREK